MTTRTPIRHLPAVLLVVCITPVLTIADAVRDDPEPPETNQAAFSHDVESPALDWGPCPDFMPASCGIAVLQGDPAQPNADIFFRMEADTTVPPHWHQSAERMVLVSGELHVDYIGQETTILTPGTYAYGPAGKPHSAYCTEGDTCVLFIAFNEPVDAFAH